MAVAPAETHLDYPLPQMDGVTQAWEVTRVVARLPGVQEIEAEQQAVPRRSADTAGRPEKQSAAGIRRLCPRR